MQPDGEGFLYPRIDAEKCVKCQKCLNVCALKAHNSNEENIPQVYAFKHSNLSVRMDSRSGGIFTAISDQWLACGGVVYGCVMDEQLNVMHIRAKNVEERNRMRGSKYVQSDLKDVFCQVERDLKNGIDVLFTGTACQTASLQQFIGNGYLGQLMCIDIVCHGVPGPRLWKSYVAWQEKKHHGRCISFNFRDKAEFGWKAHIESMVIQKKSGRAVTVYSDLYKMLFNGPVLRPSCYECQFKKLPHMSDITIGDFWGIDKIDSAFNDDKGVSLVLINTSQGRKIFEKIKGDSIFMPCSLKESIQPRLISPTPCPHEREQFYNDICNMDFDKLVKKYTCSSLKKRLIMRLRILKHRYIKSRRLFKNN